MPRQVILCIDAFTSGEISGWGASLENDDYQTLPLLIQYGENCSIINRFYQREDIRKSGFGTGEFAFRFEADFSRYSEVSIYDLVSHTLLWNCSYPNSFEKHIRKTVPNTKYEKILNPEKCLLIYPSESGNISGINNYDNFIIYSSEISYKNNILVYFQIYDKCSVINSLEVSLNNTRCNKNIIISSNENSLAEFWTFIPRDICNTNLAVNISGSKIKYISCTAKCVMPDNQTIYIACNNNDIFARFMNRVDLSSLKVPYLQRFQDVMYDSQCISMPSILAITENRLFWNPAHIHSHNMFSDNNCHNIMGDFKIMITTGNNTQIRIDYFLQIYMQYGVDRLIECLYLNILNRCADEIGHKMLRNHYLETAKSQSMEMALISTISSLTNSDEYKTLNSKKRA